MIGADAIAEVVLKIAKRIATADDRRRDEVRWAVERAIEVYPLGDMQKIQDLAVELLGFVDDQEQSLKERRRAVRKARGLPEDEDDRPRSFEDER